jgi:AcrR family transcriptional regulator
MNQSTARRRAPASDPAPRRNKGYEQTHQEIIEVAVRLLSQHGVGALTMAAVAREMRLNRTTLYYHFENREELIAAVKVWSSEQLGRAFASVAPLAERIDYITRFVLENPELIKLWIEDFLSPGDIRDRYPQWDALVDGMRGVLGPDGPDAEVWCVNLMTSAILGPRVFRNSVRPEASIDSVVRRFRDEWLRALREQGVIP